MFKYSNYDCVASSFGMFYRLIPFTWYSATDKIEIVHANHIMDFAYVFSYFMKLIHALGKYGCWIFPGVMSHPNFHHLFRATFTTCLILIIYKVPKPSRKYTPWDLCRQSYSWQFQMLLRKCEIANVDNWNGLNHELLSQLIFTDMIY